VFLGVVMDESGSVLEGLEQYLDWDEDDGLIVVASSEYYDEELVSPVDELIEDLLAGGRGSGDYRFLYCVAHELNRHEEAVRRAAEMMEDDQVPGLFNLDPEDLQ